MAMCRQHTAPGDEPMHRPLGVVSERLQAKRPQRFDIDWPVAEKVGG